MPEPALPTPGNEGGADGARARELATASDLGPVEFQDDATRDAVARLAGYLPNTLLTSHTGEKLHFYDDLVRDRCVLIQFMYTTCEGT